MTFPVLEQHLAGLCVPHADRAHRAGLRGFENQLGRVAIWIDYDGLPIPIVLEYVSRNGQTSAVTDALRMIHRNNQLSRHG